MRIVRPVLLFVLAPLVVGCGSGPEESAATVGRPAPEITLSKLLQAPAGSPTTLAGLKGRAVVLDFWATWCRPCVASFPHLNRLAKETKDLPVTFLAVTDEEAGEVREFLLDRRLDVWVGIDADGATNERYGITSIPRTVLIDKDGIVRAVTHPGNVTPKVLRDLVEGKPIKLARE